MSTDLAIFNPNPLFVTSDVFDRLQWSIIWCFPTCQAMCSLGMNDSFSTRVGSPRRLTMPVHTWVTWMKRDINLTYLDYWHISHIVSISGSSVMFICFYCISINVNIWVCALILSLYRAQEASSINISNLVQVCIRYRACDVHTVSDTLYIL